MEPNKCCVCIPIYKERLNRREELTLLESIKHLTNVPFCFIGPKRVSSAYYQDLLPSAEFSYYAEAYFESPRNYSKLLLNRLFYESFSGYEFLFILQTDALIFKNELPFWVDQGYDYIGAPWPDGINFPFHLLTPSFPRDFSLRPIVGNGGLSLRRVSMCLAVLDAFPDAVSAWSSIGNPEDVFFGMASHVLPGIRLPNLITAARFSIETKPEVLLSLLGGKEPFGCHAFDLYGADFWGKQPFWPDSLK